MNLLCQAWDIAESRVCRGPGGLRSEQRGEVEAAASRAYGRAGVGVRTSRLAHPLQPPEGPRCPTSGRRLASPGTRHRES